MLLFRLLSGRVFDGGDMLEPGDHVPISARGVVVVYRAGVGGSSRFRPTHAGAKKGPGACLPLANGEVYPPVAGPKSE